MVLGASFGLQIALASSLLAGDYYVTYSLASKQLVVVSEKSYISKAITPLNTSKIAYSAIIENTAPISKNEQDFVKDHLPDIIDKLLNYKVQINSIQTEIDNNGANEKTYMRIGPIPVKIDFYEDFVTIKAYEEE